MAYTSIDNPELYFQVELWTGTGSENARTLDGDENMQPDFVWIKRRSTSDSHTLYDSVRGVTDYLISNATDAEATNAQTLKSFDSDGFTLGTANEVNKSSDTFVAWCWKESADAGFDIVTYTGNGSARTISHSLSAVPKYYVVKQRNSTGGWIVYHVGNTSSPETDYLRGDKTDSTVDDAIFNDTAPTSSVFSVGTNAPVNGSDDTYVTYLFAEKQGYSKFGSYTGNGSTDGPMIYLGFRPAMFIIKRTNATEQWEIVDNKRNTVNPVNDMLVPNGTDAETAATTSNRIYCDFLSNGVKMRSTASSANEDGGEFIFLAFAEAPFVNSNGVPVQAR